jgi:hypothetical protein
MSEEYPDNYISPERIRHILRGDATGGGHAFRQGRSRDFSHIAAQIRRMIADLGAGLSDESVRDICHYLDHDEYGLACESLAFNIVRLDLTYDAPLFEEIASGMDSTGEHYINAAKARVIRAADK